MADNDCRLKTLLEARSSVKRQVDSFGASPIFGFTKWKFALGVGKTYFTTYLLGRSPADFWKWHVLQFWAMLPIHAYRWWHMKKLLYFSELCWITNLSICSVLPLWHCLPNLFTSSFTDRMMSIIFAMSVGPLAFAVPMLGNALVPHSIDHTMSLLIHLSPLMTSYSLKCHIQKASPQCQSSWAGSNNFWDFLRPVLGSLAAYTMAHSMFHLTFGLRLADCGHRSSPADQLKPKHSTVFTKILGRLGSGGSDVIRYLKYEALMFSGTSLMAALTFGLYRSHHRQQVHFGLVVAVWCSTMWNGATWYAHNLERLLSGLDTMIESTKEGSVEAVK